MYYKGYSNYFRTPKIPKIFHNFGRPARNCSMFMKWGRYPIQFNIPQFLIILKFSMFVLRFSLLFKRFKRFEETGVWLIKNKMKKMKKKQLKINWKLAFKFEAEYFQTKTAPNWFKIIKEKKNKLFNLFLRSSVFWFYYYWNINEDRIFNHAFNVGLL